MSITLLALMIIIAALVYYYVIFVRHKELGKLFVFLTALLSTGIQFAATLFEIAGLGNVFGGGEGHPNGDAIRLLVIFATEPFWINIASGIIWLIRKIIWLYTDD